VGLDYFHVYMLGLNIEVVAGLPLNVYTIVI